MQGNSDFTNKIKAINLILVLHHVSLERKVIATEYYLERRTLFDKTFGTLRLQFPNLSNSTWVKTKYAILSR